MAPIGSKQSSMGQGVKARLRKIGSLASLWLFRSLNLNLRAELVVNISLLILAAVVLIGFTLFKITERSILAEKVRYGQEVVQDLHAILDFLFRDRHGVTLGDATIQQEIKAFSEFYLRDKRLYDLVITDEEGKVIVGKGQDPSSRGDVIEPLKKALESGQFFSRIEKSGAFWSVHYEKIAIYGALWSQGKVIGGVALSLPTEDVIVRLLQLRRSILIAVLADGVVLIAFGTFLLSRTLVKPIKELVELTQKIMRGDFSQKVVVRFRNEIGQLEDAFNQMMDRLRENQESLENHVASLELANKRLKEAQEELIRTEKLVSIGRFAAGVAHEVGNPLGAILGYTSMLAQEELSREEAKDYLRRIEKEIERINRIVRELLNFARPSKGEIRQIEVNKVLEASLSLLSYQKGFRNIKTQLHLSPDLPLIQGDENQLSQVFINIFLNAIDAMPEGGVLSITSDSYIVEDLKLPPAKPLFAPRRRDDPQEVDYSHLRKSNTLAVLLSKFSKGDRVVRVRISDTGIGIRKEDLERIFDPFFTTKDPNKGTGLGLSVSLRIVESMGGEIRVESEPGKGSTFELYFPT